MYPFKPSTSRSKSSKSSKSSSKRGKRPRVSFPQNPYSGSNNQQHSFRPYDTLPLPPNEHYQNTPVSPYNNSPQYFQQYTLNSPSYNTHTHFSSSSQQPFSYSDQGQNEPYNQNSRGQSYFQSPQYSSRNQYNTPNYNPNPHFSSSSEFSSLARDPFVVFLYDGNIPTSVPTENIVGTCTDLEKHYLRLTAAPDPARIRPPKILKMAYEHAIMNWNTKVWTYPEISDQLKSIRQDLRVQHIETDLTVSVYSLHCRLAMEHADLAEFSPCLTVLLRLFESLPESPDIEEFIAYYLLFSIYKNSSREIINSLNLIYSHAKNDVPKTKSQTSVSTKNVISSPAYLGLSPEYLNEAPQTDPLVLPSMPVKTNRIRKGLKKLTKKSKSFRDDVNISSDFNTRSSSLLSSLSRMDAPLTSSNHFNTTNDEPPKRMTIDVVNPILQHALNVLSACNSGYFDYLSFFYYYRTAPGMSGYILDWFVAGKRLKAMQSMFAGARQSKISCLKVWYTLAFHFDENQYDQPVIEDDVSDPNKKKLYSRKKLLPLLDEYGIPYEEDRNAKLSTEIINIQVTVTSKSTRKSSVQYRPVKVPTWARLKYGNKIIQCSKIPREFFKRKV